jgi:salicylate hydroxylase
MAIEDAIVLAELVATSASIPVALDAYALARRPRIAKMLTAADDNRDLKTSGPMTARSQVGPAGMRSIMR